MSLALIQQHLIDPELCIRCNSCQDHCASGAISNNGINYAVEHSLCNACQDCVPDCPTGAINNWVQIPAAQPFTLTEQLAWHQLPALPAAPDGKPAMSSTMDRGAPASAAQPVENLYHRDAPLSATVLSNQRATGPHAASDIVHLVLDVGVDFPFLEGQTIGVLLPGRDAHGRPHTMRLYSIASARSGENGQPGTLALTVKRVLSDHAGNPVPGVCSNFICDVQPGQTLDIVGPYGASFLMPQTPESHLLLIATGTGIAPMRGMMLRHLEQKGAPGQLSLFYGGRTPEDLPYLPELHNAALQGLDLNLAFSRVANRPKQYVQDLLIARHETVIQLLTSPHCCIFLCGLKGMETGVMQAFQTICERHDRSWPDLKQDLLASQRLHIETY